MIALIEFLNHHGGQGTSDWVAALAEVETDRLVEALGNPRLTVHPAAVALEMLQAGRRQPAIYAPILLQALAEKAVGAAAMLVADAHYHQQPLADALLTRFWDLLADPTLPGEACWSAIDLLHRAGIAMPAPLLDCLSQRPAAALPVDLWLFFFSRLFDFQPDRPAPIDQAMRAATLAFAAGQVEQAMDIIVTLLRTGVDFSGVTIMLVHLCRAAGDHGRAIRELSQIIETQPRNLSCLLVLADEYFDLEEMILSADYLWKALEAIQLDHSGRDFSAILNVIRTNCAQRRSIQHQCAEHLEQAVMCYRAVLADGSTDLALWHNLGMALVELGRDDEAFAALKQAKDTILIRFWPKMTPWPELTVPVTG